MLYQWYEHFEKAILQLLLLQVCEAFLWKQSKNVWYTNLLCISREEKTKSGFELTTWEFMSFHGSLLAIFYKIYKSKLSLS